MSGCEVTEWAMENASSDSLPPQYIRQLSLLEHRVWKVLPGSTYRSTGWYGTFSARDISEDEWDVVLLHWIARGTLATREIPKLRVPVVWVLHDLWPILGVNHYLDRPIYEDHQSLADRYLRRKRRIEGANVDFVAPSSWAWEKAVQFGAVSPERVHEIPYPLDATHLPTFNKLEARAKLEIAPHQTTIGFADLAGVRDPRKGWDILVEAVHALSASTSPAQIAVAGMDTRGVMAIDGCDVISVGRLESLDDLGRFYSAMDVVAVPSRQDVVNQVAMEAQMCGVPVVTFEKTGVGATLKGAPGAVLVNGFSSEQFQNGLLKALTLGNSIEKRGELRHWAMDRWDPKNVGDRYRQLFETLRA